MDNNSQNITICRCEDITLLDIKNAIDRGFGDFEELKRYLRVGMGPCQGRTCIPLIRAELAKLAGKAQSEIKVPTKRQPVSNLLMGIIEQNREK
jgi:bacterioferritin-associated ferredoxin